jgi:hypothetical protein
MCNNPGLLQLQHLTSLTQLWVRDNAGVLQSDEQLPLNLRVFCWDSRVADGEWSVQPLLRLSCLQKLQLHTRLQFSSTSAAVTAAATSLAQLSSLTGLQKVELTYRWKYPAPSPCCQTPSADAVAAATAQATEALAASWGVLPVTSLAWSSRMPAAVFQHSTALQGLTRLELISHSKANTGLHWASTVRQQEPPQQVEPSALTALLQHMTGLQQLHLNCSLTSAASGSTASSSSDAAGMLPDAAQYSDDMAALVSIICSLPETANVMFAVQLSTDTAMRLHHLCYAVKAQRLFGTLGGGDATESFQVTSSCVVLCC